MQGLIAFELFGDEVLVWIEGFDGFKAFGVDGGFDVLAVMDRRCVTKGVCMGCELVERIKSFGICCRDVLRSDEARGLGFVSICVIGVSFFFVEGIIRPELFFFDELI